MTDQSDTPLLHANFDRHYQGYIVKDVAAAGYQRKLLHAVKTYNASHV